MTIRRRNIESSGWRNEDLFGWLTDASTFLNNLKSLLNEVRAVLVGDSLMSAPALATGTTTQNVATAEVHFTVSGTMYRKAAVAAGTALSGDNVPQNKYGAWALDIGANLTIDITPAAANATGYDSAVLAAAGIPAVAADHVRLGYCTAMDSSGAFDPGTTALDGANVTEAYVSSTSALAGLSAAISDTDLSLSANV